MEKLLLDACKYNFLKSLIDLIVSAAHVLLLSSEYLELLLYSLSLFLSMYVRMLASCCFTNSFKACHNFENFLCSEMGMLRNHARVQHSWSGQWWRVDHKHTQSNLSFLRVQIFHLLINWCKRNLVCFRI